MTDVWQMNISVVVILFALGLYCLFSKRNIIKLLIGFEILAKAATLSFILSGYMQNNIMIAQAIVITVILIDVIIIAVGLSVAVNVHKHTGSLDVEKIRRLRG